MMKSTTRSNSIIRSQTLCFVVGALLLQSCSPLQPLKSSSVNTYTLDAQFPAANNATGELTLLINTPSASSGFDTPRMIYLKKAYILDYYAQNQWVDPPARMLAPLLVAALESSAKFRAVHSTRSAAKSDLRLDTEIIRLQHEFLTQPSQIHLTLRIQLLDLRNKTVLATREFDLIEPATSEDPYGGVLATNRAVKNMLLQIADFSAQASQTANK